MIGYENSRKIYQGNRHYKITAGRIRHRCTPGKRGFKALPIIALPNKGELIEGVIDVRGSVIFVIDLGKRLGLSEQDNQVRIAIIEVNGQQTGFIVEDVSEVLWVTEEDMQPPSNTWNQEAACWKV